MGRVVDTSGGKCIWKYIIVVIVWVSVVVSSV